MTFDQYQHQAHQFACYKESIYPLLGLCEEVGELHGKMAKLIREGKDPFEDCDLNAIKKELGDILWNLSAACVEFGLDLEDVAKTNLGKLTSRGERGVICGDGDDR